MHYGSALEELTATTRGLAHLPPTRSQDLVARLQAARQGRPLTAHALDVVRVFAGTHKRTVDPARLSVFLEESLAWRHRFRRLACRGFSFELHAGSKLRLRLATLRGDVCLRLALVAADGLYYPPKVRRALRRFSRESTHLDRGIGWLLGTERQIRGQKWWFIINMQSDLMSDGSSCLKETFAGWQRVLLSSVADLATTCGVSWIALPSAAAVTRARSDFAVHTMAPEAWKGLYDGTAEFFGLRPARVACRVDLQAVEGFKSVWCSEFFVAAPDMFAR